MAVALTASLVLQVALAVVSLVISQKAAAKQKKAMKKQREEAERRADAAKGIQMIIENEAAPLFIAYGRCAVGGIRCWHKAGASYVYSAPAAGGKAFHAGNMNFNKTSTPPKKSPRKNEFLVMQQALAAGGISQVIDIDIDDRKVYGEYLNEFNEEVAPGTTGARFENAHSFGCIIHAYINGGIADPLAIANDGARTTATFTGVAYVTGAFHLNRDNPQYGGPPAIKAYVEGRAVSSVVETHPGPTYSLSIEKTFSTSPPLLLLDYLMDTQYGKGLKVEEIDLKTFYHAALDCDRIVMADVPKLGAIWFRRPKDPLTGLEIKRDIRQYECNLGLDTSKPIRENIERLMDTMPGSLLVWTGGVYKLRFVVPRVFTEGLLYKHNDLVQHGTGIYRSTDNGNNHVPSSNSPYWTAEFLEITDDDIVREGEMSVVWPNAQTRLNHVTVRFLNESKDFKQDVMSWPPKDGSVYSQYLSDDHNTLLESDVFVDGISTSYHAVAHAEHLVRDSRNKITYELPLARTFLGVEPGDFIRVTSEVLRIPGELLRIDSVDIDSTTGAIKISGSKFDANTYAWNVADNEIVPPRNIYSAKVESPTLLTFESDSVSVNIGRLSWTEAGDIRVKSYDILYSIGDITSNTIWTPLLNTEDNIARIPYFGHLEFNLAIASKTYFGTTAAQADWPTVKCVYKNNTSIVDLSMTLEASAIRFTITDSSNPKNKKVTLYVGDNLTTAQLLEVTTGTVVITAPRPIGEFTVWAISEDIYGLTSNVQFSKTFRISRPNGPRNFTVTGLDLRWETSESIDTAYPIAGYQLRLSQSESLIWVHAGVLLPFVEELFAHLPNTIFGTRAILLEAIDSQGNFSSSQNSIILNLGDPYLSNVVAAFESAPGFSGTHNGQVVLEKLKSVSLDKFYGDDEQPFFVDNTASFYEASLYGQLVYETEPLLIDQLMQGMEGYVEVLGTYKDVTIEYRLLVSDPFYGADGNDFYDNASNMFYGLSTIFQDYIPLSTSLTISNQLYQLRLTFGSADTETVIDDIRFVVDVPDFIEAVEDIVVSNTPTPIAYSQSFHMIKAISATLQTNNSGAVTVEIDKTTNLAPTLLAFNSSHVPVSGAKVDVLIKGY
jgi:hypothetical protein